MLGTAVLACTLGTQGSALASGLMLYEVGSDNVGLANAGAAARAQGPATLASNVAGLSYLPGTQISAGLQMLHSNLEFSQDASSNIDGEDSGNAMEWAPGGSLFISQQLDEQWHVGFASYGDFGLSINYENDWSGRYFMQNGELLGMTLLPSVAYRLDEQWSFGLGLRAIYAAFDTQLAVDNSPLDILDRPDGKLSYQDSDWGYGANLGVIYQPQAGTRIGLSYTSEIEIEFEDGLDLEGLDPGVTTLLSNRGILGADTQIKMHMPQTLTLSLYHALDSQWALLASANWQDWSRFGQVGVQLDTGNPVSASLDANYRDTWHLSLGSQYQASPRLLWNLGLAYDSSPVSDEDRTLSMPMGETWRLGTGITYALDGQTDLNLSYALVWMGDMEIDQQKALPADEPKRVSGEFDDAWIQALSASATWRF
ncbi:MAG TPA: OmpP1/FadL family transporter [Pseudomonas sp.]|nr:OmpP1/FadL family transporter [Pseudomonas sp.]